MHLCNEAGYDCDGNCIADTDGDGICDAFEVAGCTDPAAANYDPFATDDDASCLDPICIDPEACNYTEFSGNDYCLIVQPYQVHDGMVGDQDLTGYVTYRIYIKTQNSDDFVSSVSGDNEFPTRIMSTGSFLQSPFGGLLGSDQNPSLFAFFPAAEYDSFVTIGLTEGAGPGEGAINTIEDEENPWGFNFEAGQDLLIDDAIGGGWFIFNGQSNGIAGEDNQVLLAQVTTDGALSGSLYVQTFINGSPANEVRTLLDIEEACVAPGGPEVCEFPDAGYDCDGNCVADADGDGICDEFEVAGCSDDAACNYDADATDDDGSCFYNDAGYDCDGNCLADTDGDGICDEFEVAGCSDDAACNYNADATDDDGSCTYADTGYDCDGNCIVDTDGDGICDEFEVAGCSDEAACNYNADATDDDGSCTYADTGYDCDGNCIADTDGDGICDAFEVAGCTDPAAANYDPFATDDDASCLDPICIDPEACNYTEFSGNDYCLIVQPYQVHDGMVGDQDLTGYVTYRIYIKTQNSDDFVSSVSGDNEFPTRIMSTGSFLQSPFGGLLGSDQNPSLFAFFPAAEYDSFVTIGLTEGAGPGEGAINTIEDEENPWGFNFEAGQDLLIDDAIGGGWFIFNGQSNGIAGEDNQVLLAQVTTDGALSGSLYVQTFINGSPANEVRTLLDIEEACVAPGGPEVCEFPDAGYDCDGNCLVDTDGDGICDEFEVAGCINPEACNYVDPNLITDLVTCILADEGYDCDGNCLADTDGDGICDEFEIEGCLDEASCNYDADATDINCIYADTGYDCDGNCIVDTDGDGICDEFESAGCTEENACNYDAAATDDDGSCVFCGCEGSSDDSSSPYTLTVEAHAADIIPGQTTYRIYQNLVNADDFFSSVFGNNDDPFSLATTTGFYNSAFGGTTAGDINPAFLSFFPELAADSWVTVGIEAQAVAPEVAISAVESADQPWVGAFAFGDAISGQDIVMNDFTGGAWYVLNGTPNGLPDENNRVLIMQITTAGEVSGVINTQVFENGNGNADIRNTYSFSGTGTFSADGAGGTGNSNACGCTDAEAFNYDPDAQYDDGSCIDSVNGCTDDSACNYDAGANTEDGSCTYADAGYDCDGNCIADTDGDGICDEFEVAGCSDEAACNYDADATDDDGSCFYNEAGYDCDGNCIADTDGDGICDEFEVAGCSDEAACNYNADATDDDRFLLLQRCRIRLRWQLPR